jgi:hypothetical protein
MEIIYLFMIKICQICNKEFEARYKNSSLCINCKDQYSKWKYANDLMEKNCKYCDVLFIGKRHEKLCENCKGTRILENKEYDIECICPRCNKIYILEGEKNKTKQKPRKSKNLCPECHQESIDKKRKNMLSDNNPAIKKFGRRKEKIFNDNSSDTKDVGKNKKGNPIHSERMKKNNPMRNPESKKKMMTTMKSKKESGELVITSGSSHGNWKGNRDRAQTIRTRLYKIWVYPILEKNNFKCSVCGVDGRLEVHHKEPFRDILEMFLKDRKMDDLSPSDFEILISEIIKYHVDKPVEGIVFCVKHHKEYDDKRR